MQGGDRLPVGWLDVLVSVIGALRTGVLAGIALDGDDQFRCRLNAPHCVDEIAGVLGVKFQPELDASCSGAEFRLLRRWTEVGEMGLDDLRCWFVEVCAHLRDVDREVVSRERLDGTLGDAEFGTRYGREVFAGPGAAAE